MRKCANYCGQDTSQYTHIGTDLFKLPLNTGNAVDNLLSEIRRRCGSDVPIFLYKNENG